MSDAGERADDGRRRGTLRVYLGAAPGVGKTFAMLSEGNRARERGADVVVGFVETHGRERTAEQVGELEVVPRRRLAHRGAMLEEMDVDAVLRRHPERVLVDELAHTNVPGSRNEKRWHDVELLRDAGIDVITTVNIQHLESLNDVVERITGVRQRETVPDEVVRGADQVELVDQTPEALRRRMAHGNVYRAEQIDAALANYLRSGNLAALRELALLWVADKVDVGLEEYRERHGITEPWETRERVVVALTGAPGTEALIRRAARIAQRAHGDLVGVHITSADGLRGPPARGLDAHRRLLDELGGAYRTVTGGDVADALVRFARAENATQLVLGASQRSRWAELTSGSVINRVIRASGSIDVHVISHERSEGGPTPAARAGGVLARLGRSSPLGPRRVAIGLVAAVVVPALLAAGMARARGTFDLPTVLLLFLAVVVTVAAVGGTVPAVVAAVVAFLFANWYFTPPFHRWTVAEGSNVVALLVFLGVALAVSRFVDTAARRSAETARARTEAEALAGIAGSLGDSDPLPTLVAHLRAVFAADGVALLSGSEGAWRVVASDGEPVPTGPEVAEVVESVSPDTRLVVLGGRVAAEDRFVLKAFADQLAVALEHGRLRREADRAGELADANALRSALLQAVSHDLRTPLAAVKASVSSLRAGDVAWSDDEVAEFLRIIEDEADRLAALIENLLDMSRVQAGVLRPALEDVPLDDLVAVALSSLGPRRELVDVAVPASLPAVRADSALLERVVANVVENAVRHQPPGAPVRVEAAPLGDQVVLRVIDRGPGIPADRRGDVFRPFQRLGDTAAGTGVGLGLAVARGFADAMGAAIELDDTPGGGLTVSVVLEAA